MVKLWRKEGKHGKVNSKLFTIWHQQWKFVAKIFWVIFKIACDCGWWNLQHLYFFATLLQPRRIFVICICHQNLFRKKTKKKLFAFSFSRDDFVHFFQSHHKVHSMNFKKIFVTLNSNDKLFREFTSFDCDESLIASSDRRTLLKLKYVIVWFAVNCLFWLRASQNFPIILLPLIAHVRGEFSDHKVISRIFTRAIKQMMVKWTIKRKFWLMRSWK